MPGGNITDGNFDLFYKDFRNTVSFLDEITAKRIAHSYGTDAINIIHNAKSKTDMGIDFGHGLTQHEVDYLVEKEWAMTVEDILWRRTKLGLYFTQEEQGKLAQYLQKSQ